MFFHCSRLWQRLDKMKAVVVVVLVVVVVVLVVVVVVLLVNVFSLQPAVAKIGGEPRTSSI